MQNLLKLIVKYGNFLIFIILEVAAFALFVYERPYPKSTFLTSSNRLIAHINKTVSSVTDFFSLSENNEMLMQENSRLYQENLFLQSTLDEMIARTDTPRWNPDRWRFIPAKVVDIQSNTLHNYLVINKGETDSVKVGEGVICSRGVVGVVSAVNSAFALVTPIIHPKLNMSCRLKNGGNIGFLHWQGVSPHYASLTDIARHIVVHKGDTVITSGLTAIFPEGLFVGVVDDIMTDDGDVYHKVKVKLSTDFSAITYVQVLDNPSAQLQQQITPLDKQ